MNVNSWLKLTQPSHKFDIRPSMVLADGCKLSVQASSWHMCLPKQDIGPYTHVEVWNTLGFEVPDHWRDPDDWSQPMRVPVTELDALIAEHGGIEA